MSDKQMLAVPVDGGELAVAQWGSGDVVVLALHGITANHLSWALVAEELAGDDVTILAPDLRGRGASGALPGPYGYAQHVLDLLAVLDHVGADRAVFAGHSMGGFVSVRFAMDHADRMHRMVLVDGGPSLPIPPGLDPDVVLEAVLGPALQRLDMTFTDREAYRDFWRAHPALGPDWNAAIESYVDHDLHEVDGSWRSKVNAEAIRTDGRDPLVDVALQQAIPTLDVPMHFLWAHRGLMAADPLYPREVIEQLVADVPQFDATWLEDVNHYTIALAPNGAKQVAAAIREAAAAVAGNER